jgi:hypothetical protein
MEEFSSVAQYERNCHTGPMFMLLGDTPGNVDTISDFMLTASKHKIKLSYVPMRKLIYKSIIVIATNFCGKRPRVNIKCKLWSSFYCDMLSSYVY